VTVGELKTLLDEFPDALPVYIKWEGRAVQLETRDLQQCEARHHLPERLEVN